MARRAPTSSTRRGTRATTASSASSSAGRESAPCSIPRSTSTASRSCARPRTRWTRSSARGSRIWRSGTGWSPRSSGEIAMTSTDLAFTPATELAGLIRAKKLSPVELTRAVLDRVERINPIVNAFCTVTADLALAAAREAERALMKGEARGPLHGIPFSIKDLHYTKDVRTMSGSFIFAERVPDVDPPVIRRRPVLPLPEQRFCPAIGPVDPPGGGRGAVVFGEGRAGRLGWPLAGGRARRYVGKLDRGIKGLKVAFSADLGGFPVDAEVAT